MPKLATKEPARAEAMTNTITNELTKATLLPKVAKALPASERARKQALLDQAMSLLRDDQVEQMNATRRLRIIAAIAEQWLDMGERDCARLVIEAGKSIFDPLSRAGGPYQTSFPAQLCALSRNASSNG